MIVSSRLSSIAGLRHGFLAAGEAMPSGTVHLKQVHSNRVIVLEDGDARTAADLAAIDADGLIARRTTVAVRTADCLPVLMADPRSSLVAAVHAGWRGLESGIILEAIDALARLGARASDLEVALGPSIAACCYEVSNDVSAQFERKWSRLWAGRDAPWSDRPKAPKQPKQTTAEKREAGVFIDLQAIARLQLAAAGVPEDRIDEPGTCTYCGPTEYASYRRATHENAPRRYQWSFIGPGSHAGLDR
jgi:YfiH family protein